MTILALLVYLLILLVIAYSSFQKIKGHNDFFIAGKQGSFLSVSGSLMATILGGSAIIGTIDAGPRLGWATIWFMLCAAIGLLALLPLVKKITHLGRYTLPELLEDLFGTKAKTISSVIIPIAWLGIIAAQIIAAARILESFTGLSYNIGVIVSGLVFILYTVIGGQVSVLKTDLLQAILILSGLIIVCLIILKNHQPFQNDFSNQSFPFNNNFKFLDLIILFLTYSTTFTAGPDIYSRIFCAKNENTARKSLLTTALILIPVAVMIGFISTYGAKHIPMPQQGSLLVEISNSILPKWSVPIIAITFLSAVLSSADTTILSASIIITDLVEKGSFGKKSLKLTRITILVIGILSIIIALNFNSIIELLLVALTIYSGAFFLPLMAGLTGYKIKKHYLSASIITGGSIALLGKLTGIFYSTTEGNIIIIVAFIVNAVLLAMGIKKPRKPRFKL